LIVVIFSIVTGGVFYYQWTMLKREILLLFEETVQQTKIRIKEPSRILIEKVKSELPLPVNEMKSIFEQISSEIANTDLNLLHNMEEKMCVFFHFYPISFINLDEDPEKEVVIHSNSVKLEPDFTTWPCFKEGVFEGNLVFHHEFYPEEEGWLDFPKNIISQSYGYPKYKIGEKFNSETGEIEYFKLIMFFSPIPDILKNESLIKEKFAPILDWHYLFENNKLYIELKFAKDGKPLKLFEWDCFPQWKWNGGLGALNMGYFYIFQKTGNQWVKLRFDRIPYGSFLKVGEIKPGSLSDIFIITPIPKTDPPLCSIEKYEWNKEKNQYFFKVIKKDFCKHN
jgi:hypothetical protein